MSLNSNEIQDFHQDYFYKIPVFIAEDKNLNGDEVLLYGLLSSLANRDGYSWASDDYLAKKQNVTPQEIRKRIKNLEDQGYIFRQTKKNGMYWDRKIFMNFNGPQNEHFQNKSTKAPNGANRTHQTARIDSAKRRAEQDNMINNINDLIDKETESDKFSDGKPLCSQSVKSDQPTGSHNFPQTKEVVNMKGEKIVATYSDFVRNALRKNKLWTTSLLEEAWKVFLDKTQPFTDWLGYLFKICETIEKKGNLWMQQNNLNWKENKNKWKKDEKAWKTHKKSDSVKDTEERPLLSLRTIPRGLQKPS